MSIFSRTKPARLEKKISIKDKIICWFIAHRYHFLCILIILIFILTFVIIFLYTPVVESGQYYRFKV